MWGPPLASTDASCLRPGRLTAWPPPLPPATEPNRPQSTRRWLIIPAVVIGAVVLAIGRLRWRYYDVPSTYREACRAGDEVLNIGAFGFLVGIGLAVATLVLCIKRRWSLALAFGAATLARLSSWCR
jgi:hypothetical protein